MAFTEKPPVPPPPDVARVTPEGKPTQAQVEFEKRMNEYLKRLAAAVP